MTEKTDISALRDRAECMANLLDNLAGYEPSDIDMDTVELRFEDESGCDTGCDVSIVDTAQQSADIIRALLDQLEAERQQREAAEAELAALRGTQEPVADVIRDANRYRFLRDEESWGEDSDSWNVETRTGLISSENLMELRLDHFDAAIDARMAASDIPFLNPVSEPFTGQHKPVVVHPDTVRMDWLCTHVVEVRQPMFYGSHAMFFGQCDSADDEEYHSKLREQIDAAIKVDGSVVKDGE